MSLEAALLGSAISRLMHEIYGTTSISREFANVQRNVPRNLRCLGAFEEDQLVAAFLQLEQGLFQLETHGALPVADGDLNYPRILRECREGVCYTVTLTNDIAGELELLAVYLLCLDLLLLHISIRVNRLVEDPSLRQHVVSLQQQVAAFRGGASFV